VRFLLDAQLPPALGRWLVEQGHDALLVRDVGLRDAVDGAIWAFALQNDGIILTKDEDFPTRSRQSASGPVVVWLRVGNCSNAALRAWLAPRLPGIVRLIVQGSRLVEVI